MSAAAPSPLFLGSETSLGHDTGPGHPERPDRWRALRQAFAESTWRQPPAANRSRLTTLHDVDYVDSVFEAEAALEGTARRAQLDADTVMSDGSLAAALEAVGAAITVTEEALAQGPDRKLVPFAASRPPGHHAERDRAMGFCLFNSVALAAEHGLSHSGVDRVAIVDWDVHHGNGTQHLFEERSDVLFVSCHRFGGFYPGTGAVDEIGRGAGRGATVNLPLSAGTGDDVFVDLFHRLVAPVLHRFAPDLILVSAGYDAHVDDPLGGLAVTGHGFGQACAVLDEVARSVCQGRIGFVLEGGYSLEGLVEGVGATLAAVGGTPATARPTSAVDELIATHRRLGTLDGGS